MTRFTEIRSTFFNEETGLWYLDAWRTMNDNEEGTVVATINPQTFEVNYMQDEYKNDEYVLSVVKEKLQEIFSE